MTCGSAAAAPVGALTEFPITSGSAQAIAAGPDGNLWLTEKDSNKIGRIAPTGTVQRWLRGAPQMIRSTPSGPRISNGIGIAAHVPPLPWFSRIQRAISRILGTYDASP